MNCDLKNNNGQVLLTLEGRMDTSVISHITSEIYAWLNKQESVEGMTCDIHGVDYISSSGLRLILQLAKQYDKFCIIEVQPIVYQVFEMTGFTQMMKIEKALRNLCVEGCEEIGRGGVGVVYRLDEDTIIKVFREGSTIEEVRTEISMAKDAFVMGMPTAISFDIVKVNNCYGLVYELLEADTLSSCIKHEPERMDEFARLYAGLFRQLHSIHVPAGSRVPNAIEREENAIRHISRYFDTASVDLLLKIIENLPDDDRLLHCDLQTKNAMLQGDELMVIDMGEVAYGHPLLDLGHAYSSLVTLLGDYDVIIGMPREYGRQLWNRTMNYYFEGETPNLIAHRLEQMDAVGTVRNFSWLALSDSFPEAVIRECQQAFAERVTRRKDYLLSVSKTFGDWK